MIYGCLTGYTATTGSITVGYVVVRSYASLGTKVTSIVAVIVIFVACVYLASCTAIAGCITVGYVFVRGFAGFAAFITCGVTLIGISMINRYPCAKKATVVAGGIALVGKLVSALNLCEVSDVLRYTNLACIVAGDVVGRVTSDVLVSIVGAEVVGILIFCGRNYGNDCSVLFDEGVYAKGFACSNLCLGNHSYTNLVVVVIICVHIKVGLSAVCILHVEVVTALGCLKIYVNCICKILGYSVVVATHRACEEDIIALLSLSEIELVCLIYYGSSNLIEGERRNRNVDLEGLGFLSIAASNNKSKSYLGVCRGKSDNELTVSDNCTVACYSPSESNVVCINGGSRKSKSEVIGNLGNLNLNLIRLSCYLLSIGNGSLFNESCEVRSEVTCSSKVGKSIGAEGGVCAGGLSRDCSAVSRGNDSVIFVKRPGCVGKLRLGYDLEACCLGRVVYIAIDVLNGIAVHEVKKERACVLVYELNVNVNALGDGRITGDSSAANRSAEVNVSV